VLEPNWMLVSYRLGDDETPRLGVLEDGVVKAGPIPFLVVLASSHQRMG